MPSKIAAKLMMTHLIMEKVSWDQQVVEHRAAERAEMERDGQVGGVEVNPEVIITGKLPSA